MPRTTRPERPGLLIGAAAAVATALVVALLSLALPGFLAKGYDQKSREALRREAQDVRTKFGRILGSLEARKKAFAAPLPADPVSVFALFKRGGLDAQTEGIARMNGDGNLDVWYGNVVNLIDIVSAESFRSLKSQTPAFLVKNKASVFLVVLQTLGEGKGLLAHFRLLAFVPQFQSSYILEYQALGRAGRGTSDIVFWDFAEDVSGFEKFFARNRDEFVGQPRRENEIQTLFFPLRNEVGRIMATVTLSSPSLTAKLTTVREDLLLILFGLVGAAGVLALIALWTSPGFRKRGEIVPGLLIVAVSVGLRLAAVPLAQLGRVRGLPVFSPMAAGFSSLGTLTQSPADMLLTALMIFSVGACLAVYAGKLKNAESVRAALPLAILVHAVAAGLAAACLAAFHDLVRGAVDNANIALLRWSVTASALFMHLGLLLCLATAAALIAVAFRLALLTAGKRLVSGAALLALSAAGLVLLGAWRSPVLFGLDMVLLGWVFVLTAFPAAAARRQFAFFGLFLAALWMTAALENLTIARSRTLLGTTLKRTIQSQEPWGNFLMEESFPEIDRAGRAITAFFTNPADTGYAHALWRKTLVAKFNWYSSLELRDAEGNILSRFSLNVPKFYGQQPELEPSEGWTVVRQTMNFLGKEMEFLVGYRDWRDGGRMLGRLILYVSMDPEMLPFLNSANPYFEVLRTDPMPSLNQFDFGCAIYDLDGNPLFNPQKMTAGIAPPDLERLNGEPGDAFWSKFVERGTAYDAFLFRERDRCYSLFTPVKKLKTRAVEFLRLFFFYLLAAAAVLLAAALVRGKARLRRPLRSFSNRVYAAFLAVALIPLVMYSFFTRSLFDRIFTERFVEDAAIHASFARGLMEAFLVIQGTEVSPYLAPSEDLALWISSTLANDVTLYSDAIVVASSRREFFDAGLLPDLLDGTAYESLVYERKPYFTERRSIGGYSFQNLTVPYEFKATTLFISLPFPFERQEVARATREIVEFLVLLGAFFLVLVILFSRGIRSMIIVPVRKLLAGTREVGLGNLEVTIDHRSRDEMMTLIDGFNTMIKNLKAHEQELAEMSKKVAWTEMARKVAHEIKNPLTPIQLSAEHVLKVYEDKKGDFDRALRESMSYIISEVENLRRIAQEFMEISRDTTLSMEPLDLKEVLDETLRPYRRLLSERIRFRTVYSGPDFAIRGDAVKLRMAFRNVIANAVEAISQKGEVRVAVGRERTHVTVAIGDTGPGMDRATIERIFDPYFSTKDAGTGLGLPIAKKIIEEHGGTIHVESEPGKGTTVTVRLPVE